MVCLSVITKLDFPGNLCRAASQFLRCYYLFSPKPQNKVKLKVATFFRARKTCNYLTSSIEVITFFLEKLGLGLYFIFQCGKWFLFIRNVATFSWRMSVILRKRWAIAQLSLFSFLHEFIDLRLSAQHGFVIYFEVNILISPEIYKMFLQCIYHAGSEHISHDQFHHQVTNMKDTQLAKALERIGKTLLDFDGRKCPPVRCGDCL